MANTKEWFIYLLRLHCETKVFYAYEVLKLIKGLKNSLFMSVKTQQKNNKKIGGFTMKKVLKKSEIIELLKQGHFIRYESIWSTCQVVDKNDFLKVYGVVRFDTYMKLDTLKVKSNYSSSYYTLKDFNKVDRN